MMLLVDFWNKVYELGGRKRQLMWRGKLCTEQEAVENMQKAGMKRFQLPSCKAHEFKEGYIENGRLVVDTTPPPTFEEMLARKNETYT